MARDERGQFTDGYDYGPPSEPTYLWTLLCFALGAVFVSAGASTLGGFLFLIGLVAAPEGGNKPLW